MTTRTPETPTELAKKTVEDASRLVRSEAEQARELVQRRAVEYVPAGVAFAAAAVAGIFGLQLVAIAPGLAHPARALASGIGLLGLAGLAGAVGAGLVPEDVR
jgi:hypothetical protein